MKAPNILIVDDEEDLRDAIAFDFKRRKYNVFTADSGTAALAVLDSNTIDVVLTDVKMSAGSGIELLEKVKDRNIFKPAVIFISAFADISLDEAYDKGAEAVFTKPFDREALFQAVERSLIPAEKKLNRINSRVESSIGVGVKFLQTQHSLNTNVKNIGRGGFFISLENNFPLVGEKVDFCMAGIENLPAKLSGTGVVRWKREKNIENNPLGCGIEFTHLDSSCRSQILELINHLKTKTYIPRK